MAYTGYERYANENRRTQQKADTNMRQVNSEVNRRQAEKRAQDRANKTKMEGFINSMPEGFDAEQLSDKYKPGLEKFLKAGKDKYANAAMEISDYEPGTEEYQFYKDQMSAVTNSFKSAKTQVDLFGTNKKDLGVDLSNGTYSKGNDIGEMSLLTDVYTDQYDMVFNENGTIGFDDGSGNITSFNELPDYFNKDFKTGDAIQKMAEGIYKSGQPFNPATKLMHRNKLQSMIEQGGIETLYSLANDDFFNSGGLGIPDEILKDPNRRDEVENMVIDQFLGVLESQAKSGSVYGKKKNYNKKKLNLSPKVNKWVSDNEGADLKAEDWMANVFAGTKYYLEAAYASAEDDAEIKGYYIVKEGRRSGEGLTYVPDLSTSTLGPIIEKLKI
tara:strand:+ start:277 stop:1434 length:1158 start_codon:yes stop_codon:yes gene_type:complete